ncbi:hypothetical protein BH09BAC5_BH09BAC5_12140 [soil metagenome]
MKFYIVLCIFLGLGFTSNQTTVKINNKQLIGTWVYSEYKDELLYYEKKNKFEKDKSGIEFKEGGKIIKRQNASWCGTPPITYANYDGTWEKSSDSTLTIIYQYWGGMCREVWLVSSLSKEKMVVKSSSWQSFEKKSVERDRFR